MEFLSALFTAAFDNNIVFAQLVGMVAVFLMAFRPQDALRFGALLWAAVTVSGLIGWPIYAGFLAPWGAGYLAPIAFVLVSTVAIFTVGALWSVGKPACGRERVFVTCTLLSVNAAVLAVPMGNAAVAETTSLAAALGTAVGAGFGAFVAVVVFATLSQRISMRMVPEALRGLPISLVTASLVCLAFSCVAGIAGGLFV